VYQAIAGDEPVPIDNLLLHAEIAASMTHEFVELFKRAFIEKKIDALADTQLAFGVLAFAALFSTTILGIGVPAP
jgi:hypothetical protein